MALCKFLIKSILSYYIKNPKGDAVIAIKKYLVKIKNLNELWACRIFTYNFWCALLSICTNLCTQEVKKTVEEMQSVSKVLLSSKTFFVYGTVIRLRDMVWIIFSSPRISLGCTQKWLQTSKINPRNYSCFNQKNWQG